MDNLKISKEEMDAIIKELQRSPGSLAESRDIDMMQGKYPKTNDIPSSISLETPIPSATPYSTPSADKDYQMSPEELTGLAKDIYKKMGLGKYKPSTPTPTPAEETAPRLEDIAKNIYKNMGLGKYKESTPTPAPSPFGPEMSPEMRLRKVLENMDKSGEKFINRSPSSVTPYDKAYPMPSKLNLSNEDIQDMLKSGEFTPPFTQPTPSDSKINRSPDANYPTPSPSASPFDETEYSSGMEVNPIKQIPLLTPEERAQLQEYIKSATSPSPSPSPFNNIRSKINRVK